VSRRALPYRVPSTDAIRAEGWILLVGEDEILLPEALPDWDYQMDLSLRRSVGIDLDRVRAEARLQPEAALNLTVVWTSTGSNLRGRAECVRIEGRGEGSVELTAHLKGADLGGLLKMDTVLVLADPVRNARPTAPHRAGSILWSDRRTVRLQGDAPQFPIAVIDFVKTSFPDEAAWHLQIGNNLLAAAMGSLLLLVNEQNNATTNAFRNAGKPRQVDLLVLSAVYADVARIMVEHALRDPDFIDGLSFPEDTLGATLVGLFHQLFPDRSINDLRLRLNQSPSLFAAELQAAVKIFKDI
jgi:hypothetical protein